MRTIVQVLNYVNLALFTLLAVVALHQWRRGLGRAALWAALTFGALAIVVDVGRALPDNPEGFAQLAAQRLLIAVLVLFPFFLYRFSAAFRPPPRRLERFVASMTTIVLVWTFALPELPQTGEPRPLWFKLYVVAFVVHWSVLALIVTTRLLAAGRGEPSVARRRMELLGIAALLITVAIVIAAIGPEEGSALALVTTVLVSLSALAFLLGLAPPVPLRVLWRAPELAQMQDAIAELMTATGEEEVARRVLPPMARIVGARAVALRQGGRVVGAYGASEAMLRQAEADSEPSPQLRVFPVATGSVVVWTSPYAPFFGREELRMLQTLTALTGLALDRSRLFAREVEARRVLERADELKTQFIALAAHELRTPVAAVYGLVQTMAVRADQLSDEDRARIDAALREQAQRMRLLVDQLLDLSRLDAEAVSIEPERFFARPRLEELAGVVAGPRATDVALEVDPALEVQVDPGAFDRVVTNLIGNALRYGLPPVLVRAERRDRHLHLSVEDRGPGVRPDFIPQLFERFTRSEDSSRRTGGTGLGLAIARSYARAHGGDLVYEPAEPHGARFRLVIPADYPTSFGAGGP